LFQLDENLEQWPHLNQLVQCYGTEWVKDVNKYGHYENIRPDSFQTQIFEGPDTDTETGNYDALFIFIFFAFVNYCTSINSLLLQRFVLLVPGVQLLRRMLPVFPGGRFLILDPLRCLLLLTSLLCYIFLILWFLL